MRYLFAGGGTGGHIYPALAMAQALKSIDPQAQFLFIGSRRGLEKKIIPSYGYPLKYLDIQAFQRKVSWDTVVTIYKAVGSLNHSRQIIRDYKPDVVIGTGGYVSGPPVLVAHWLQIPTVIQEQNALPGFTTKLLFRRVDAILLGYEEAQKYLGSTERVQFTGNPIRSDITKVSRADGAKAMGLDPRKTTMLIMGASQGSRAINTAFAQTLELLSERNDIQIIWQTGESQYPSIKEKVLPGYAEVAPGFVQKDNLQLRAYINQMPEVLAACDLVVSRAGAISLAEITAKGLPSILIPLPTAAENHQEYNARALERAEAAEVILEKDLTGQRLCKTIEDLLDDDKKRLKMAENSRALGRPEADRTTALAIFRLAKRKRA